MESRKMVPMNLLWDRSRSEDGEDGHVDAVGERGGGTN